MLEKLNDVPAGIDGLKAVGKLSKEDYEKVCVPILDEARRASRRIRFLYQFGPEFDGFTPGAAWEDAKIGLGSMRLFEGCAVVTDVGWIRESAKVFGFVMPCPVRVFALPDRAQAVEWLQALPKTAATTHRLLPEKGVIVLEVEHALRAQDFDALALTADTWIEGKGELKGLVIHAREFPGWENLGGFFRHIRFVRDHHKKVERIALAVDSKLASLATRLGEHFIHAEVERFGYEELQKAVDWASGTTANSDAPRTPAAPSAKVRT
jgi:hypothetical protein